MFKNMKLKKSLLLGYGVVIFVSLVIIVASIVMMLNIRGEYDLLMDEDAEANQDILYCRICALIPGRNIRDSLLIPDSEANAGLISTAEQYLDELELSLKNLEAHFPYQLEKDLLNDYLDAARAWAANAPKIIELYEKYRSTGNESYLREAENFIYETDTPMQTEMGNAADALDAYLVQGMADERARIESMITATIVVMIVAVVVSLIFIIAFAFALVKSITGPTEQVHKALVGFSEGKLDIPVDFESNNELGEMCKALRASQDILGSVIGDTGYLLKEMASGNFNVKSRARDKYVGALSDLLQSVRVINSQLSDTLGQITQSTEQVAAGADQVSTGAQALAQGATEQASSVQELSATISEISNESVIMADTAREARDGVLKTGEKVVEANDCVTVLNNAMNGILTSSSEIAKIIAVIENIAFQTNILALNAAVEAARAGNAGKGFAVVADEVRNLASKSDEAAKSTKTLIDTSIKSVEEGANAVEQVTQVLTVLGDLSKTVVEQVDKVANIVEHQSTSMSQVTEGIDQISSVVQNNSATSEQSAAASEELSSQAALIKSLMQQFTLTEKSSSEYHTGAKAHSSNGGHEVSFEGSYSESKY